MNAVIKSMLSKYDCKSTDQTINALREILQEIALLGLWRGKLFERAAFYGGTSLRVLYGLDRFSEDMDFSLLSPQPDFELTQYAKFIEEEIAAFGFIGTVETKVKTAKSAIESAFLKANTREHLLITEVPEAQALAIPDSQSMKIKIEVDTDPPMGFSTTTEFLLQPIPFSVRVFSPASAFAGKMHAILCRNWTMRVKGRDWYDLVWYVSRDTKLNLAHLESRMRQSGHYKDEISLTRKKFVALFLEKIESLNVKQAAGDVRRFLPDPFVTEIWSKDFFAAVARKISFQD